MLRRLWEGDLDVTFDSYSYQQGCDVCAGCSQKWTYYYLEPNEHGGKTYIGHRCEHTADCIVGTIERLIGVHQINPDVKVVTEDGSIER